MRYDTAMTTKSADVTEPGPSTELPCKSRKGFRSMTPEKQREIASMGGRTAHERGVAHEFTSETAREAGRLGGLAASRHRAERREAKAGNGD